MTKKMLLNAIDEEESRMAIVEEGKLVEFNIRMSAKNPIIGNIYKGVVQKVEPGLRAAFIDYGGKKNGFLPLNDVSSEYLNGEKGRLTVGQHLLVKVLREERGTKGAMLTTYISLPGRYIVLMPNRKTVGISRKIAEESDRKKLKDLMEQIGEKDGMGYILRTAGMNRTKQELMRDYQMLLRLWKDIKKKAEKTAAPTLVYEESDFGIRAFRDYYTTDIGEILVDHANTYKKMREYCRAVSPRSLRMIKLYRDEIPIFDKYRIEDQISAIYQQRVELRSGGYIIISPTEAMTTIDVNSGRASKRRDVEETAYQANIEAAVEIARQLRLRDLGGLIVIDFIDMKERKHNAEVEKTFKNALALDRARIQLSKISRFGILELSRQKKQSTIQEISYSMCPHCKGSGMRPSIEYTALSTFRRIKSRAVERNSTAIKITLPHEVSDYLLNQKRSELSKLESLYDVSIYISGCSDMIWGDSDIEVVEKGPEPEIELVEGIELAEIETVRPEPGKKAVPVEPARKRKRPRPRRRRSGGAGQAVKKEGVTESHEEPAAQEERAAPEEGLRQEPENAHSEAGEKGKKNIVSILYDLFKS